MIKSLRNRHRQIWMAWAVLLPIGIVFSWLVIPNQQPVKLLQDQHVELLPVIIQSKSLDNYDISIRSNTEKSQWQLEWRNKKVLTVPSAVIYKSVDLTTFTPEKAELIGRIEAQGDYTFPFKPDSTGNKMNLVLYDFIHQKTIETISF